MSHLSIERLAALADEQATADEKEHLTRCETCARELDAHRSLLAMAGTERESMGLPLTRWDSLSERLRVEGLMLGSGHPPASRWALQAAAALLLVAGGVALGRVSTGQPALPGLTGNQSSTQSARGRNAPDSLPMTFASVDDATRWKDYYSEGYQRALAFLAQHDSAARPVETPAVMRARLAALNQVSKTMQEALSDAPYDPIINDFYLNSFGQREATLRQLNNVLPQNVRLNSF